MNIEIPLRAEESAGCSNHDDLRSIASSVSSQSNLLDERPPFALYLGPEGRSLRLVHVKKSSSASRSIADSLDASTTVRRTPHRPLGKGCRLWERQVLGERRAGPLSIRCTRFARARAATPPLHQWELDLEEAAHRPLESELLLTGPKEPKEGVKIAENGLNGGVSLLSARLLTDDWVELLLEDGADPQHRLVVMWHAMSSSIKRWRLSPEVRIHTAGLHEGVPGIIVDEGRGFLPLGTNMSDRDLLAMVMVHSGATTADRLCNMNQMDRCTIPLRALEASLAHRQLDTVAFYLTSSLNAVDHWLRRCTGQLEVTPTDDLDNNRDLGAITRDLQDAVGLILPYMENLRRDDASCQNEQYCHQLSYMLNEHLIKMLTKAVAASNEHDVTGESATLLRNLQNFLHSLYGRLKTFMDSKAAKKRRAASAAEQVHSDPSRDLASKFFEHWDRFARTEVVVDALAQNAVPLMVEYLLQRKVPISVSEIHKVGLTEVRERLRKSDWAGARFLVLQMGLDVSLCFEDILWETGVIATRNFLLRQLHDRCMLSPELQAIWAKLERLETIYSSHNFHAFRMRRVARPMLSAADGGDGFKDAGGPIVGGFRDTGGPPAGNRTRLLLTAKASALAQVPSHRGSQALATREAEAERAEAGAWPAEAAFEAEDAEDEEASRERTASLAGHLSAYHRFRLFALRHVPEEAIVRMLIDQANPGDLGAFMSSEPGPATRYLLDHVDVARLMTMLSADTAPMALQLRHRLPQHSREILEAFLASEFDIFEAEMEPPDRLLRYIRSQALLPVLKQHQDLRQYVLTRLVFSEAAGALHALVMAMRPVEDVPASVPSWAEAALTLSRSSCSPADPLPWALCSCLLGPSPGMPALVAAALLSDRAIAEVLPGSDLSALHSAGPGPSGARASDLYVMLRGCLSLQLDRVFGWQKGCALQDSDFSVAGPLSLRPSRPHFSELRMIERLGNRECLGFQFYLLHRRPAFAFLALAHSTKGSRAEQRRKEAAIWAHQLAIENSGDGSLVAACLAFITLLLKEEGGRRLRCHLMCLRVLRQWRRATLPPGMSPSAVTAAVEDAMKGYVELFCTFCLNGPRHSEIESGTGSSYSQELYRLVSDYESAILWQLSQRGTQAQGFAELLLAWAEILNFAQLHRVTLPTGLLEHFASRSDWLGLLATAQLFPFVKADLRCVLSRFCDKGLRDHLSRVIDRAQSLQSGPESEKRTPQQMRHTPLASALAKRDPRRALYSSVGVDIRRSVVSGSTGHHATSPTSPDHSPANLASSIESRESDSAATGYASSEEEYHFVKLQAAIEALSTDSLFELLLTVRSPRTLLAYAMTLSHPLLAILAICTACDPRHADRHVNRVSYFCGFLVASLPYRKKQLYLETWDGRLVVDWDLDRTTSLIKETLHRHSFRELEDATYIFMPRNPLHYYLAIIRVVLEFRNLEKLDQALSQFREATQTWLDTISSVNHVSVDGMNEPDEEMLTRQVISGTIGWVCGEVLREQSARVLLTVLEGVCGPDLAPLFEREKKDPFPLEMLRQLVSVLLECHLPVDSGNLLLESKSAMVQSCSEFAHILVREKRFRAARRVLEAVGPCPEVEVVRHDVERAEAAEVSRQRERFQPKLNIALDRVMRGGRPEAGERLRSSSSFALASDLRRPRGPEEVGPEACADLLFRPAVSIAWRPPEEAASSGPWRAEVERLLDCGSLQEAYNVLTEAGTELYHEDLVLLLYGVRLACRAVLVEDLPEPLLWAMTQRRVRPSSGVSKTALDVAPAPSFGISFLGSPLASGTPLKSPRIETPSLKTSSVLQSLPLCIFHGHELAERICMMHRVSEAVDAPYELVLQQQPLEVLSKILGGTIVDKVAIAEYFVRARRPPQLGLCRFLLRAALMIQRHNLSKAAIENDNSSPAASPMTPSPSRDSIDLLVELPEDVEAYLAHLSRIFSAKMPTATALEPKALIKVTQRPGVLGELFLDTLRRYLSQFAGREKEHALLVEMLVLAHESMELAGSTEGIADCLRLAVQLTRLLNAASEFRLLVRLLTGMRRYGEMNYIFGILLDRQCMEVLLSKDATKNERFKIALIEYLKRHRPKDTETWNMVLAFFSMTRENAEMKEAMASALMRRWVRTGAGAQATDGRQSALEQAAMTLIYATNDYIRLRCYRRAKRCFRKAQLCALQSRTKEFRLIDAPQSALLTWITNHSEFYEAYVVCETIGLSPRPWVRVLWDQVIVRGDSKYMEKFRGYLPLTRPVVRDLGIRLRRWCATDGQASSGRSQAAQKRQQYVANLRHVLRNCEDKPLVLELCREFGIVHSSL